MGAWDTYYHLGDEAAAGTPEAYGIIAVKGELVYNGATGLNLTKPGIGRAADNAIRTFQSGHGLTVDGEVGPLTGAKLFAKRFAALEKGYSIPDHLLCKLVHLESGCDPGAVGVADPRDLGIVQIHMPAHPSITVAEAFSPPWALHYLATALRDNHTTYADWHATIASWNVGGGGAAAWLAAGKPASLFEWWFVDAEGDEIDLGARATEYVKLVRGQSC